MIALLVLLVGATAGAFVHVRSEADAKKSALTDATFAAGRAATQIKLGFDTYASITAPVANASTTPAVFADPTKCAIGYAPIASLEEGLEETLAYYRREIAASVGNGTRYGPGSPAKP